MANSKPVKSFTKETRKSVSPRGKSKKTLILDAIKERALLGISANSTKDDVEKAVFGFMAEAAFNPTQDTAAVSNTCLNQLMKKGWSDLKAVDPSIEFQLSADTVTGKAYEILDAISQGDIPPSTGVSLINALSSVMKIEEIGDLKDRLEAIEKALNAKSE